MLSKAGLGGAMQRSGNEWLHGGLGRWQRWLCEGLKLHLCIRRSQSIGESGAQDPLQAKRYLQFVALTFAACVALLSPFGFMHKNRGGLADPRSASGAVSLLEGMVARLSLPVTLVFFADVEAKWGPPRPPAGVYPVSVRIGINLGVDISEFLDARDAIIGRAWGASPSTVGAMKSYPDELHVRKPPLCRLDCCIDERSQVAPHLRRRLRRLGRASRGLGLEGGVRGPIRSGGSRAAWAPAGLGDDDAGASDLHRDMSGYQLAGQFAAQPHLRLLSIAADGSRICARKRLLGVSILPTGEAIWWPPQASGRPRGGGGGQHW